MDDLSKLSQGLGGGGTDAPAPDALDATATPSGQQLASAIQAQGGIDALIGKLRAAGLGDAVDSWVGTGPNQALAPQQLGTALGDDGVQRLSAGSGLDIAALLPMLAAFLPQIIDMLTPNGSVPAGGIDNAAKSGGIPDLGGLLGGVLGGAGAAGAAGTSGPAGAGSLDDLLRGLGGLGGGDKGR